jgi:hypothetical protein
MATSIYTGSASPGAAATGRSTQGHLIYAVNQGAWWVFYLTSTNQLSAKYSTDGATWNTPSGSPFTLTKSHNSEGRNFGFGYASISGTDALIMSSNYLTGGSFYAYGSRFTLGTTWSNTNAESLISSGTTGSNWEAGGVCCYDSSNYPILASTYIVDASTYAGQMVICLSPNQDSGASWTSGWGSTPPSVLSSNNDVSSCFLAPLGSRGLLACEDNADTDNNHYTQLNWNSWNGSTWSQGTSGPEVSLLASSVTSTDDNSWGACKVSSTALYVLSLSNNSNSYVVRLFNGSSWSTVTAPGNLTYATTSGLALVSDGTNVWAFAISSGNVEYNKYTVGAGTWGGWTVLESSRTNTPAYITACINSAGTAIQVAWTEKNGTNYEVWTSQLSLSSATNVTVTLTALSITGGIPSAIASYPWTVAITALGGIGGIPAAVPSMKATPTALSITGGIPVVTVNVGSSVTVSTSALSITGALPATAEQVGLTVSPTALSITGALPATAEMVDYKQAVTPLAGTGDLPSATPLLGWTVLPTALAITGALPIVTSDTGWTIATTALAGTGAVPVALADTGWTIAATTIGGTGSLPAVSIGASGNVTEAVTALAGTGNLPQVTPGATMPLSAVAGTGGIPAASILVDYQKAVTALNITGGVPVAIALTGLYVQPTALNVTGAIPSPTIKLDFKVAVTALNVTGTVPVASPLIPWTVKPTAIAGTGGVPSAKASILAAPAAIGGTGALPIAGTKLDFQEAVSPLAITGALPSPAVGGTANVAVGAIGGTGGVPVALALLGGGASPSALGGTGNLPAITPAVRTGVNAMYGTGSLPAPWIMTSSPGTANVQALAGTGTLPSVLPLCDSVFIASALSCLGTLPGVTIGSFQEHSIFLSPIFASRIFVAGL